MYRSALRMQRARTRVHMQMRRMEYKSRRRRFAQPTARDDCRRLSAREITLDPTMMRRTLFFGFGSFLRRAPDAPRRARLPRLRSFLIRANYRDSRGRRPSLALDLSLSRRSVTRGGRVHSIPSIRDPIRLIALSVTRAECFLCSFFSRAPSSSSSRVRARARARDQHRRVRERRLPVED